MKRAYYFSSIDDFCKQEPDQVLGKMAREHSFDLTAHQRDAWIEQTRILKDVLLNLNGKIYFEFSIPRMGRRIDAVIIIGSVIFVVEFKVGATTYEAADLDQVMDYALDLQNFHEGSHCATLVPVLVATNAQNYDDLSVGLPVDRLFPTVCCNGETLGVVIHSVLEPQSEQSIDCVEWESSGYKPTPTIIEATLALYNGHSVSEISRSDASATNLSCTSGSVSEIITRSKKNSEKSIVFVTGVPGAGKTLVGLDVATTHIDSSDELYSVFLSGNGPLVRILQEALARDKVSRKLQVGEKIRKGDALSEVKAFIQNVHHFRDDGLLDLSRPPVEHVALFDEAQRAWGKQHTIKFMRDKKNQVGFNQSEPEFLISCMDRHPDWATVVCLVGGGQEINTGEGGIGEWFDAIKLSFPHWKIYISDQLTDSEYGAGEIVNNAKSDSRVTFLPELHLKTSVRSFRSEKVSLFVKQLLDLEEESAKQVLAEIQDNYPIVLTRDFEVAKNWLRDHARGSERYGMVVSSHAERLKPYAIDVRVKTNPVHWFLNGKEDVRSSYYLEDVATEFVVQGLELDWVCMAWDADFRYGEEGWGHWSFRGSRWQRIKKPERQIYQKNAYRVLLTRARQGMVMVVPEGDDKDITRPGEYYDGTYRYLKELGLCLI
ncbi:MAG: hypothetical protein DRR42_22490 [Gammaproteobacteria bacterium]|nr:MAG: hypothetical protein DRR42_22490 [Gammaproteobacteria bacterium]